MSGEIQQAKKQNFSLLEELFPFALSVLLLIGATILKGDQAGSGYHQLALLLGAISAVAIGLYKKRVAVPDIWKGIQSNLKPVLPTVAFLMFIGAISVTWLLGGVVPSVIYYGVKYINPRFFLVTVALFSGLLSIVCGSSWLTVSTIGVAFLSIGNVLGFHAPLVAGAVISGAYFGDKLTPLSDTTVLASTMTKTPLLRHVRYMLWSSIPAFLVSLLIFAGFGYFYEVSSSDLVYKREEVLIFLENTFDIRLIWFLVPFSTMLLALFGLSPFVILALGCLTGGAIALFYQPLLLDTQIAKVDIQSTASRIWLLVKKIFLGVQIPDENGVMNQLSAGGIFGMWKTLSIILSSVILSGAMEGVGLLDSLMNRMSSAHFTESRSKLIGLTILVAIFFNVTVADQYLAIILTSKLFMPFFWRQGLSSENLSRAVEDSATVTSPLIPWNTCGATQAHVLGVSTLKYLPYSFFNLLSPLASFFVSFLDIKTATAHISGKEKTTARKPRNIWDAHQKR